MIRTHTFSSGVSKPHPQNSECIGSVRNLHDIRLTESREAAAGATPNSPGDRRRKIMKPQKWLLSAIISLAAVVSAFGVTYVEDDTMPEVRDRVARISVMQGDVQIKRADSDEWEAAAENLPLVEGDEIATGDKARLEIQFENDKFARIDEDSYVKIVNLNYSGIALSLSQGSLQVSLLDTGNEDDETVEVQEYFEVDAPRTTVAFLQPGSYRIDAGANEVRVTVPGEGEARIYSTDSGFTLGSVRSAVLALTGEYAGEWNTHAVFAATDRFDSWIDDRQELVTARLANAHYDEYYDDDIYGAEDLNANGDWIHTPEYGYIWQPYSSAISSYSNWSPYRYGQWRWVSPYGWTWVNDEPWGWATYHYGRWVYYHGRWAWTPYGYYRWGRSWWSPALVLMSVSYGYVSWCPLPYTYAYYNYNYHYWNNHHGGHHGGDHGGHNPTPTPTPNPTASPTPIPPKVEMPVLADIDPSAATAIRVDRFGNGARSSAQAPVNVARNTVKIKPADIDSLPILPDRKDASATTARNVRIARPIVESGSIDTTAKVGAAPRTEDAPLDRTLREKTIFGGRTPVTTRTSPGINPMNDPVRIEVKPNMPIETPRNTGAVARPTMPRETPVRDRTPGINPGVYEPRETKPIIIPSRRENPPIRAAPTKPDSPVRIERAPTTRPSTPVRIERAPTTRPSTPVRIERAPTSRPSTPTRSAPQRSSPPPARSRPSPTRSSPPPSKSESKPSSARGKKD